MTNAPEKIWAWETLNCNGQWTIAGRDGVEYIRADIHETKLHEARVERAGAAQVGRNFK